jgi:hypothetical protein
MGSPTGVASRYKANPKAWRQVIVVEQMAQMIFLELKKAKGVSILLYQTKHTFYAKLVSNRAYDDARKEQGCYESSMADLSPPATRCGAPECLKAPWPQPRCRRYLQPCSR